jgi:hypothetical protein
MQPSRTQPDANTIVHQQLDPFHPPIGEDVGVMRTSFAQHAYHTRS